MGDPLRPVVGQWVALIERAREQKKREFQDDADEAMSFFDGPYDWLYSGARKGGGGLSVGDDDELPAPAFRMTVNKVAEMVQLFGPALYHRNPVRKVNPRKPVDLGPLFGPPSPQDQAAAAADQARAALLEAYLNHTPNALDLKAESRWAIEEAIVKGLGCLWTEVYTPVGGGGRMTGSFFDTCDNLFMDPDAEVLRDCKWVARRCCHPVWQVEREYGLPEGSLRAGQLESHTQQAAVGAAGPAGDYRRKQGRTSDLVVYWKVYSKMGLGGRIVGIPDDVKRRLDPLVGDYVYLVVADGVPHPLNLPPPLSDALAGEDPAAAQAALPEARRRLQWPTPFWADDAWPVELISFLGKARKLWPISLVKPGMGELKFLNWAFSFLAGKVRTATRDFIAVMKSAGSELKDRIQHGADYTIVEVEQIHGSIDAVVKFLQHPGFNPEIYRVIEGVTENFERRTGLTELMYGMSARQMRSAQEASVKSDAISVRPDDMADRVENAMSAIARKEALAARWHLTGADVAGVVGPTGAAAWDQLLTVTDPALVLHSLEYRVEAGSARKPNQALDAENFRDAMQNLTPMLWTYAQATGDVGPVNRMLAGWARTVGMDPSAVLLPAPMPPPPPAPAPGGPPEGPPEQGGTA